jgi:hypothetical protein
VDDVDGRLETLEQELSDLETDLYDLGDAHYGEPTINDLDSRLGEAEDRIDSVCHTLRGAGRVCGLTDQPATALAPCTAAARGTRSDSHRMNTMIATPAQ